MQCVLDILLNHLANFMLPKRRFGTVENMWVRPFVRSFHHFQPKQSTWEYEKCYKKLLPTDVSTVQNLRLGTIKLLQKIMASQNTYQKTNTSKSITFCQYLLNHVAKFMVPKRRFWTAEQIVAHAFLNEFSIIGSPKRVLNPLKRTSKTHTQRFVQPSKIFGWGKMHIRT